MISAFSDRILMDACRYAVYIILLKSHAASILFYNQILVRSGHEEKKKQEKFPEKNSRYIDTTTSTTE